jgi:hypothetical protein
MMLKKNKIEERNITPLQTTYQKLYHYFLDWETGSYNRGFLFVSSLAPGSS